MKFLSVSKIKEERDSLYLYSHVRLVLEYKNNNYNIKAILTINEMINVIETVSFKLDKNIFKEATLFTDYTGEETKKVNAFIESYLWNLM